MMENYLSVRLNAMRLTSAASFSSIKGGFNGNKKDVFFLRLIGYDSESSYLEEIKKMDSHLTMMKNKKGGGYVRICQLPVISAREDVEYYIKQYTGFQQSGMQTGMIRYQFGNTLLQNTYWNALSTISCMYRQYDKNASESIIKNFIVKVMYWSDLFLPHLYEDWNERLSPKFVLSGRLKRQEYLFLYMLTQLGTDVLYLNSEGDTDVEKELSDYSVLIRKPLSGKILIPEYNASADNKPDPLHTVSPGEIKRTDPAEAPKATDSIALRDRIAKKRRPENEEVKHDAVRPVHSSGFERRELNYEELAKLASSVVMIEVYDSHGKCFKTGSGMMISNRGYILTNHHVACDGAYYSVRIEDVAEAYHSDEMIKYNYCQDLALIRIDRVCNPIPVYSGSKPLVRGQKVVAIGSPLGLFNSVSEGIISGFREYDDVTMIQFTAPTSHGSSGGAVLNMYGEIIGISTAGMDDGQNINLAVHYEAISAFVKGFLYA